MNVDLRADTVTANFGLLYVTEPALPATDYIGFEEWTDDASTLYHR